MRQSNLVLHCGAAAVAREKVEIVETPAATDTWVPIAHAKLLNLVQGSLTKAGLHVVTESHGMTRCGQRYFGLMQVANGDNSDDFGLVAGVRNSHDQSFPAALVLGASVFVCDNLSFSGEVRLARKHTRYIERDLPQLVERAIGLLGDLRHTQERRFEAYKHRELSTPEVHDLVIQALDARVIGPQRLPQVLAEWRAPRHPEFNELNGWRLFNAFTEVLKGSLAELPRRSQALHGLLDSAFGLDLGKGYKTEDAEVQLANAV